MALNIKEKIQPYNEMIIYFILLHLFNLDVSSNGYHSNIMYIYANTLNEI